MIDAESLEILATIACPSFPIWAEATPDGRHVLVTGARSGDLSVFSTNLMQRVHSIKLDSQAKEADGRLFGDRFGTSSVPIGIEIAPDGLTAWIAHANAEQITVVDLEHW